MEWFKLLSIINKNNIENNILDQLVALKVLKNLCEGGDKKGNIDCQRSCFKILCEPNQIILGFGNEENRPYVSFNCKPECESEFLKGNPIILKYSRTIEMAKEKKLCVFLDDLSKNHSKTIDYICYITHVLKLFSAICLGRFTPAIKEFEKRGLNGLHIIMSLRQENNLHPKFQRAYIDLARTMCIDIEPLTSIVSCPNRCYLYIIILFYSWHEFGAENNYAIISEESQRLEEANSKEIKFRFDNIQFALNKFVTGGVKVDIEGLINNLNI